jgi:protein gp37
LGVTVETQTHMDRVDILAATPAAVRFVCHEPLLGPISYADHAAPDWLIVGGENGPGARPMQPEWALDLVDQVHRANVPVWFKGWGSASTPPPFKPYTQLTAIRELPAVSS